MLDSMKKWIAHSAEANADLDIFTSNLIDALVNDINGLDRYQDSHETDLVLSGYGFLADQHNELPFSKDLWKGYALGFLRGQLTESLAHDDVEE